MRRDHRMTTHLCVHNLPNRSKSSRLGYVVRFTANTGGLWGKPRGFDHGLEIHPGFNQKSRSREGQRPSPAQAEDDAQ